MCETKTCIVCNQAKPLDQFRVNKRNGSRLNACISCRSALRRASRAKDTAITVRKIEIALQDGPLLSRDLAEKLKMPVQKICKTVSAHNLVSRIVVLRTAMGLQCSLLPEPEAKKNQRRKAPKPPPEVKTKRCTKCRNTLPETQFRIRDASTGARYSYCDRCLSLRDAIQHADRDAIAEIMPLVFELLTQHGPMQSASIIALVQQHQPDAPHLTRQKLFAAVGAWPHSHIMRRQERRGVGYVYRIVGDTRPVYFAHNAVPGPGGGTERVVDDPEGDAWFAQLQADVAERRAHRERLRAAYA